MTHKFDAQVFADALYWYKNTDEFRIYFTDMDIFEFRDDLISNPKSFQNFMEKYWEYYNGNNPPKQ